MCECLGDAARTGWEWAPASAVLAKLGNELRWCEYRQVLPQAEGVLVACDQERAPGDCQGEEVVVVGVGRADWSWVGWILGERCVVADPADEGSGFLGGDPFAELWVRERACELGDQQFGHDHFKRAVAVVAEDLGRRTSRRERS